MTHFLKKSIVVLLCAFILCTTANTPVIEAVPFQTESTARKSDEKKEIARADQIETIWRVYDGVVQYRRWNSTRNYWVDPYWINA